MKKYLILALSLAFVLSLAACGNSDAAGSASGSAGAAASVAVNETTLSVDRMDSIASMGTVANYITAYTMTIHFQDNVVSRITDEITLTQDLGDKATMSALEKSLASRGTVSVDGNTVTVTLSDISTYEGMTQDQVKTALETAGYTVTEG